MNTRVDNVARSRAFARLAHNHRAEFERILDQERIALGLPPVRRPVDDVDGWIARYQAGETIDEVARGSGRSGEHIRRRLIAAGVPLRPAHPRSRDAA